MFILKSLRAVLSCLISAAQLVYICNVRYIIWKIKTYVRCKTISSSKTRYNPLKLNHIHEHKPQTLHMIIHYYYTRLRIQKQHLHSNTQGNIFYCVIFNYVLIPLGLCTDSLSGRPHIMISNDHRSANYINRVAAAHTRTPPVSKTHTHTTSLMVYTVHHQSHYTNSLHHDSYVCTSAVCTFLVFHSFQ